MNQISNTYRLIALSMAFLMFTTTLSFSIDMHYCKGELESIALFGIAESCKVQQEAEHASKGHSHQHKHDHKEDCSNEKKNCCENQTLHVEADIDEQVQAQDFIQNSHLQQFVAVYVSIFFVNSTYVFEEETPSQAFYKPPLISRDIPILVESFLL
ncbi:MAG: hypothetical protein DWQ02_01650 [Bacteroidetes bacterium]|nr:MAG: hypothetical protein DWQ02_01650 [Bacteroidota bacterium]